MMTPTLLLSVAFVVVVGGLGNASASAVQVKPSFTHADFCSGAIKEIDGRLLGSYTWVVRRALSDGQLDLVYLSLCEPLNFTRSAAGGGGGAGGGTQLEPVECNGALACRVQRRVASDAPPYDTVTKLISANETYQPFDLNRQYLFLTGGPCVGVARKETVVLISFKCGVHLGSPQFLLDTFCQSVFQWRTSAACHDTPATTPTIAPPEGSSSSPTADGTLVVRKPRVQVPCYVIDEFTGVKYDLSYLTRLRGAHKVDAAKVDLYINVCQDITDPLIGCTTPGTAACLNLHKSSWTSAGLINTSTRVQLTRETGDLIITYKPSKNAVAFQNCKSEPSTVIHFRCPKKRGRNRPPRLLGDISCHYVIEWETDHACPEPAISGDSNSCKLNIDGNVLDLSRLRKPNSVHRVPNVTIAGQPREVIIDICSRGLGHGGPCGEMAATQTANVCFRNVSNGQAYILGSRSDAQLRYTDGRATLVYFDGRVCRPDTNRKWSTVIEFVCDSDETFGKPELVSVDSELCLIQFEWKTVSACIPDVIIQDEAADYNELQESCIYTKGNLTIDLSALYHETGSWFVTDEDGRFDYSLYVDICSAVRQLGHLDACPADSAVCGLANDNRTAVRFGRFSTVKLLQDPDKPVGLLEFSEGDKCTKHPTKRYKTLIHLACTPGVHGASPRFFAFDEDNCVLHLEWHTSVACPQVSLANTTCMVEDKTHGFRIDLRPLAAFGPQTISAGDFDYDIAVCGSLPPTHACGTAVPETAVCRRNHTDKRLATPLGRSSTSLIYNGGLAIVVYHGPAESSNIAFLCDFDAGVGKPQVLTVQPGMTVFSWATSFACPSMNTHYQSCVVQATDDAGGHLFDLSRLTRVRADRDWVFEATDGHDPSVRLRFHVALCRPLTRPPAKCDPLASVCVETIYPNGTVTVADAGHAVEPPTFDRGQLMLNYSNGATCVRRGKPSTLRTIVHFLCDDKNDVNGEFFNYMGKLDECGYSLLWTTEAACPIRHQPVKDDCTIVDRLTGDVFNVTHMRSETFYRTGDYEFNICGPIKNSTNCPDENVSVCHVTTDEHGKQKGVALAAATGYQLDLVGVESLRLSYMGDVQNSQTTRVSIELICTTAPSAKKNFIEARGPLGNDHVHRINFYSTGVCPSYRNDPTACEIINSETGNVYDLRPLARGPLSNWEILDTWSSLSDRPLTPQRKYYFNVCKKLNTVPLKDGGYNCPRGSYACATESANPARLGESLGRYIESIVFGEGSTIGIHYVGGDKCPSAQHSAGTRGDNSSQGETNPRFKSTLLTLACSPNAHESPRLIREVNDCEYVFYMETPAACPVFRKTGSDCRVTDPYFGFEFDLSMLGGRNKIYTVSNPDDRGLHQISVCGSLPNASSLCGDAAAGSCLLGSDGKNISLGRASGALQYDTGVLTLVYSNGAPGCAGRGESRTTTIHFYCDHSAKVGSTAPEFHSMDDNCGFVFSWYTELACPPRTEQPCHVDTPKGFVDLTPLSQTRQNYVTSDNMLEVGQKYVLNVCRSVVHMRALTCKFSSGACIINGDKTVNLGVVSRGPTFEDYTVRIQYFDGDLCTDAESTESGTPRRWSTLIDFTCSSEESGPLHVINENCTAMFVWSTPHACPHNRDLQMAKNRTCTAILSGPNMVIDLHSLVRADSESPYSIPGPAGRRFKLNICGSARGTSCNADTGICLEGKHEVHKVAPPSSRLVWDDGVLAMRFEGGDRCGLLSDVEARKMSAVIHFVCPSAGFGRDAPQFVSQSHDDCEYRFVWPTELACPNMLQCVHYADAELLDLSPLSTKAHRVTNIIDPEHEYYMSVCRPLEPRRPYVAMPQSAAVVRVGVNSKKVESLGHAFLEPFTDFHRSVSLVYVNGSRCEWLDGQRYQTRIMFECDLSQDAGEPVLVDISRAECLFLFRWRTNLVCTGSADAHQINPRGNCSFHVAQRGITLDLSPLANKSSYQVKVNSPDGGHSGYFTMAVCNDIPSGASGCRNSELCFTSKEHDSVRNISYGVAESFHYQGGRLYVRYTGGDKCISTVRKKYSAIVEFECDPHSEIGAPTLERQYGCVTVFKWKTLRACSPQQLQAAVGQECVVSQGSTTIDLTMLSSVSHVWTLDDPDSGSKYFINICGTSNQWPLEAVDKCGKSGVCLETKEPPEHGSNYSSGDSEFSSLGESASRQMVIGDGYVRITYTGGDPALCPLSGQHPKSVIDVRCDLDGDMIGSPRRVSVPTSTSCTYRFEWASRSACPQTTETPIVQKGGYLIDRSMHRAYNLSALMNRTFRVQEYRRLSDNYTYLINLADVCTEAPCRVPWRMGPCAKSAVCQAKRGNFMKNVGSTNQQRFYIRGSELLLVINTDTDCLAKVNETIKSTFTFSCDHDAGIGEPQFLYETGACHYIFSWPTEYVCASRMERPALDWSRMLDGRQSDSAGRGSGRSAMVVVVLLSALAVTIAALLMFLSKPTNRFALRARTLRIFRTVTMPHYHYSKTESEMQSPLDNDGDTVLLSPSLVLQPEDDDFSPLA